MTVNDIDAWGNDAATRADYEYAKLERHQDYSWSEAYLDYMEGRAAEEAWDRDWESLSDMIDNMEEQDEQ